MNELLIGKNEEETIQKINNEEKSLNGGWATFIRYIQECGNIFIMTLIFLSIITFVLARLVTAIWVQLWLDAGDGLEEFRLQNTSYAGLPKDQLKGLIKDNPKLWQYQLIYGVIIIAMLISGFFKVTCSI